MIKIIAMIGIVTLIACDPGPLPQPARSIDRGDLNRYVDGFPTDSSDGLFPLDMAIRSNRPDELRRLLEQGENPNLRWGQSGDHFPLQEVLDSGGYSISNPTEAVQLLLKHGADPNARWCPFESRGRESYGPHCTTDRATTPLIYAAMLGQREMVGNLLAAGADPKPRDWFNGSALDYAYDEIVFEMISRALFPEMATRDTLAFAWLHHYEGRLWRNPQDSTPLSRAIVVGEGYLPYILADLERHSLNRVRTLLRIGADPNERTRRNVDWTPLAMTLKQKHLRVARLLLDSGADVDLRWCASLDLDPYRPENAPRPHSACSRDDGMTPLMYAAEQRRADAVELLLGFNADRSLKDWAGRSALDYAKTDEIRKLLTTEP